MKIRSITFLFVLLTGIERMNAQTVYSIDASKIKNANLQSGHLRMGNPGPEGKKIEINNRYMTLNGKPIIPVMGEMHFSRVAKDQWEDRILKMKACGINIIACYVLWIHHEEIEGKFDWSGNKDLRAFVELCAKHGLWVYPRIGPWCHAEVRNGGTPDWVLQKENLKDRSNDPLYQRYAEEWYRQIALQLKGLMYKDGGPVIGVQLENEYGRGKAGEAHILWLKQTAQKYGIDVPMYTVTGWGNGSVPPYEVIPLWGAYPDEPWAANLNRNKDCENFQFSSFRNDEAIGNDVNKAKESYINYSAYPFFTCEVGVGIENTEHRRLQIGALDGYGLMMAKIGSGSNLPGYYMFTGGTNPHGLLTSLEENREETGYWNTNPIISYDFQAAIRESGELNHSYFEIKKLHYFLNEFGERLAPMEPVFSAAKNGLQLALRVQNNDAFLFGINYCRHNVSSEKRDGQFNIQLENEKLQFPSKPINISGSSFFIWPVNFSMENILLKYATAQPLCVIGNKWIFIEDADSSPEFCFDSSNIQNVVPSSGKVFKKDGRCIISNLKPGLNCVITVLDKNNNEKKIVILSKEEAKHAWLFKEDNKKYFFVSSNGMYMNNGKLHIFDTTTSFRLEMLDEQSKTTLFKTKSFTVPEKKLNISFKESFLLDKAQWLKTSVANLNDKNQLWHRFFLKDFSLNNPAYIKTATLFISSQSNCRLQVNNIWVNQDINVGAINTLDITGYLKKGENRLLIDFPFEAGQKAFAVKLHVEFGNADRFEIPSDSSWLTKDSYTYPSYLSRVSGYKQPEMVVGKNVSNKNVRDNVAYSISLPENYLKGVKNLYLKINYAGDKAKIYFNHRLIEDDFNNGSTWTIGLNNMNGDLHNGSLQLEISPLSKNARIYFDDVNAKKNSKKAAVQNLRLVPHYENAIDIVDIQ
jgi:hypothetical protein